MELSSVYDPKQTEERIYKLWEESGFFNPDTIPKKKGGRPFIIILPPPNITGTLHMGHALNATISDILIRWHRMQGDRVAWLPGTDHAGIATHNMVEKELRKEGKTRFDLGREQFLERVWQWKKKYGDIIFSQLRMIGASCDWSRARFTMDPPYAEAVQRAFIHYHEKRLLYRALRTVNWCVRCQTGISDLEVAYKEEDAVLYYIQYGPFILATVRPETKFGDTALAVNPKDARYARYIGAEIEIETLSVAGVLRTPQKVMVKVRVVGDSAVDPQFGTGVIKVTPAHDIIDYEIAERHRLPMTQVIDDRGRMNDRAGKYAGMKVAEARKKIVDDLRVTGLLIKEEPYRHNLAVCSRCGSAIEPLPSWQWFLKMGDLAKKAAAVARSGKIKIIPKNFEKMYFDWLDTMRDWCVSRQLWWGHQLPVYFCKNKREISNDQFSMSHKEVELKADYVVSIKKPDQCPFCKNCDMKQSEDVLDTWFSSALWPFAGLSEDDVKRFYPSSVLITARDILNLWVGRMIFSGLEFKNTVPFPAIFIHATVLTTEGKRMSKSLGTGIDPLSLIERYGADATRFGIVWQAMGTQDMHWDEAAVIAGKKMANKVWNAGRFIIGKIQDSKFKIHKDEPKATIEENKKIMAQFKEAKKTVEHYLEKYELGQALHALYDFFWHDFCDAYLEWTKKNESHETQAMLEYIFTGLLKLLHPFMPFVTEELYQKLSLKEKKLLLVEPW